LATVLQECIIEEHHSVAHSLYAKELNAKDIHKEMFPAYGVNRLSCKAVHNWVKKFSQGCLKVADDA
jgi:hypothetical protein